MVNFNGDLLPETAHFLNHQNRGLRFGDILSETIRYKPGQFLFWEEHYFRLMASMRRLRMEIPMSYTPEFLKDELRKVLLADGLQEQAARLELMVFPEAISPDYRSRGPVVFIATASPLEEGALPLSKEEHIADLFRDYYLQADELSGLDHNSRMVQVLGSIYARENGFQTCLLLNHEKQVVESLDGNLFLRAGDRIKTPELESGCRNGMLRTQLLKIGESDERYQWEQGSISPFELQKADELFSVDLISGVRPITGYRKARYATEAASHAHHLLNERIQRKI